MTHSRVVLAGFGDIAARLARKIGASQPVVAVNRSGRWAALDHPPEHLVAELGKVGSQLQPGDTLVWLAPPAPEGETETTLRSALRAAPRLNKLIYLSTSGVYGDCGGEWVRETRSPAPQSARAKRRFSGEQLATEYGYRSGSPVAIVRVPGIYGPGRLPKQRIAAGSPTFSAALSPWSNRIHAEDLAGFLHLLLRRGSGVFNVSDGQPGSITEYFQAVAQCLGLPALPEVEDVAILTPGLASYLKESRRLVIERARDLGYSPHYPDFRKALPACYENDLHWHEPISH